VLHYASPSVGTIVRVASLRRPDLVLRCTSYPNVVVDERVLSPVFDLIAPPSRMLALLVLEGEMFVETGGRTIRASAGNGIMLEAKLLASARHEKTTTLELEWNAPETAPPESLRPFDVDRAAAIATELSAPGSQRALLERSFALCRELGVPLGHEIDRLEGSPTDRDRRIACAMEEQLAHLSSRATTFHLGESAKLSPRQLQRLLQDFNSRYGISARTWRDTRNRWRVQIAAVMLSVPELSIAAIAKEVGYASGNALARALVNAGLPSPVELRHRLLGTPACRG